MSERRSSVCGVELGLGFMPADEFPLQAVKAPTAELGVQKSWTRLHFKCPNSGLLVSQRSTLSLAELRTPRAEFNWHLGQ